MTTLDGNCIDETLHHWFSDTLSLFNPPAALNTNPPNGSFANHMYAFYKEIFEYVGQMDLVILAVTQRRDKHRISRLSVMTPSGPYSKVEEKPSGKMFNIHRCLHKIGPRTQEKFPSDFEREYVNSMASLPVVLHKSVPKRM